MKKITFILFILIASAISAQTTFEIPWQIGSNGEAQSPTIEVGDIVSWTWGDGAPHTVTSLAGSQEEFATAVESGVGFQFSYTFTEVGINPYRCEVHPGSMFGTVTVVQNLSTQDKFIKNIKFYPNPVTEKLTISSLFKVDKYQIYNAIGSKIAEGEGSGNYTNINMSRLNSGFYFVKITSGDLQSTFKITKL